MTRNIQTATVKMQTVNLDPFSRDFLLNPYDYHEELRESGPVFHLDRYGIWGTARYAEVRAVLANHKLFCSGRGVGISDFKKENPWRPPSLLLETEPPLHTKMRRIVGAVLNIRALKELRPAWKDEAETLVESLVERGEFDVIRDLAQVYPLSVFPDAIGIQPTGREHLLPYANLAFNAFGPDNWLRKEAMMAAGPAAAWVAESCTRENLAPDGFGRRIFDYVDSGEILEAEGERLVRSFLTAGLDTTINGIGSMVTALAAHPEQFAALREDRKLVRHTFDEVLRWDSVVQTFFRTTTADAELGGAVIPEGEKIILFLGAANRDPRQWKDADRFDVRRRRPIGHVGFGYGIHMCVGQMIARMEAELVLEALVERIAEIEAAGRPERMLNNTLHAWKRVPVRVRAA